MKETEKKEKKIRKEQDQTKDIAPIFNNYINNKIMENSIIIPEKPGLKKNPEEKSYSNDIKNYENYFSPCEQYSINSSFDKSRDQTSIDSGFIDKPTLNDNSSTIYEIDKNYMNLASVIINKCSIDFSVDKNNNQNLIKIDNVTIGNYNLNIAVDKLENFMNISMKFNDSGDEKLENCYRLSKFIGEFKQRIIKEFINDYELQLQLELTNNPETDNDGIYDIDALYTFYEPWTNKKNSFSYREENILIYGTESNLQGFNFMMYDINQEKYRIPILQGNNNHNNKKELNPILKNNRFLNISQMNKDYKKIVEIGKEFGKECETEINMEKAFHKTFFIIKYAKIGNNKKPIEGSEFQTFLDNLMKLKNIGGKLLKNCYRIAKFIEKDFKERIENEFVNNYDLCLKLELKNTEQNNNNDIYNIHASYTFIDTFTNETKKYEEENVLINGTNSNLQGFNSFLHDINQENYRDFEDEDNNKFSGFICENTRDDNNQ